MDAHPPREEELRGQKLVTMSLPAQGRRKEGEAVGRRLSRKQGHGSAGPPGRKGLITPAVAPLRHSVPDRE